MVAFIQPTRSVFGDSRSGELQSPIGSFEYVDHNGRSPYCRNRTYNLLISSQQQNPENAEEYVDSEPSAAHALRASLECEAEAEPLPDDLAEVVQCWPGLSEAVRTAVLAVVRASME